MAFPTLGQQVIIEHKQDIAVQPAARFVARDVAQE